MPSASEMRPNASSQKPYRYCLSMPKKSQPSLTAESVRPVLPARVHCHKIGKAAFVRCVGKVARAHGIYGAGPGGERQGGQVCAAAFVRVGAALFVTQNAVLLCGKSYKDRRRSAPLFGTRML